MSNVDRSSELARNEGRNPDFLHDLPATPAAIHILSAEQRLRFGIDLVAWREEGWS